MKTVLFIDRNQLVTRSVVGGNINPDKLMPHVYTAQSKFILPILGTMLYQKLQNDVMNNTLSGVYQTLIDDYITDTLVHYSVCEFLPWSLYQFGEGGTMMSSPEFQTNPNKKDVDFLLQKSLQSAQFFAERLTNYLIANTPLYPEYFQTNGKSDNVYPYKEQKYNIGIVL
jgi:hypothetical protein